MTEPVVIAQGLCYARDGGGDVLHDISFSLAPGSTVALVGQNGSGKTTLLRLVLDACLGLRSPYSTYKGQLGIAAHVRENVAYLPQRYSESLLPWFKVRRNLAGRRPSLAGTQSTEGMSARLQKYQDEYGYPSQRITSLLDRRAYELSGGEKQAVAFTRAVFREAHLLLLDEPFSSLDRDYGNFLVESLRRMQSRTACSILLTSHDIVDAAYLADETLVLRGGRVAGRFSLRTNCASKTAALGDSVFLDHLAEITRCLAGAN